MFFKLWVRAPRITIASFAELNENAPEGPSRRTRPSSPTFRHSHFVVMQGTSGGKGSKNSTDSALSSSRG